MTRYFWTPTPLAPARRATHVLTDLWGTIALGPDAEPTKVVYDGLNLHQLGVRMDDYLAVAVSVRHADPADYIAEMAEIFNTRVPDHLHRAVRSVVDLEVKELTQGRILRKPEVRSYPGVRPASYSPNRAGLFEDVEPCFEKLKRAGVVNTLCTNTWRLCDVRRVMESYGLDRYLEHYLVSGEMGLAKQSGLAFFIACAEMLNTAPETCVVVDDNLYLGVVPAVQAGMQGILIDRYHQYTNERGESHAHVDGSPMYPDIRRHNIRVIHGMDELPDALEVLPNPAVA